MAENIGCSIYQLAASLFPICRSITGDGVRKTLQILSKVHPITIREVPSGTQVFDWEIPDEWNIRDAYIETLSGEKVVSFSDSNLHVVGYSEPVDKIVSREDLLKILYTEPSQPTAIPYVTSYYKRRYGFCMSEIQKNSLNEDRYHIVIDSEHKKGSLTYGEIIIPGESEKEIFLSTYICHPSMANNELSGPCVSIYLAKEIAAMKRRRYTYRIVFIPETIGSLTYLSQNYESLKKKVVAGFNITCVGDDRTYSYIPSRYGNTLADKAAQNILQFHYPEYKKYTYLQRGSDERQYCAPGIDLPVCVICRSKFGEYPEYHTSLDNMELITESGLQGSFEVFCKIIRALEHNQRYRVTCLGEPQLGKRGLYPTISKKGSYDQVKAMVDFIAYADGKNDLLDISNLIHVPVDVLIEIAEKLAANHLLSAGSEEHI
ncbi:MAG: DUF4910 domain-containing protein [Lachnospiraceae bacterium]|nr:DUF4910 domain-containing protein [Lachnospiraceae bacterium]